MKKINIIVAVLIIFVISFFNFSFVEATENINNEQDVKNNNFLKSLTVTGYELTPEFNKNITTYYLVVPEDVTEVEVLAETEVEEASIKITGNTNLNRVENTIKVTVTSSSRKNKTYNIIATKQKDNGLSLESLAIENANLVPDFESSKYYYEIEFKSDKDKTDLNITASANQEGTTVEIFGDKGLEVGENLITIVLQNGSNTTTYEILANITVEKTIITEVKNDNFFAGIVNGVKDFFSNTSKTIAFLSVVAIILLILILCVIVKIIKNNKANKNKERLKNRVK